MIHNTLHSWCLTRYTTTLNMNTTTDTDSQSQQTERHWRTDLLYEQVYDFDNLVEAWHEVRKGRRNEIPFLLFAQDEEEILINLQNELIWHTYRPKKTREFIVRDPKMRMISEPTYYDRILHHALMRVVEPYFGRYFHRSSFACLTERGPLASCLYYQGLIRKAIGRYGKNNFYVVRLDIKSFFASIDRSVLKQQLRRIFSPTYNESILWLFDSIIDGYTSPDGKGLPLGFLTSQQEANLVNTPLDYYITDTLGYSLYCRYMDDVRVLVPTYDDAMNLLYAVDTFIAEKLNLRLSPKKTFIQRWRGKDTWCGYVVCPHHLEPKKATVARQKRRIRKKRRMYEAGEITLEELKASEQSYLGYLKHTKGRRNT